MQEKPTEPCCLCRRCAAGSSSVHRLPAFWHKKAAPKGGSWSKTMLGLKEASFDDIFAPQRIDPFGWDSLNTVNDTGKSSSNCARRVRIVSKIDGKEHASR